MRDYIVLATLAVVVYGIVRLLRVGRRPANYPPGPPTLPLIGNLHQVLPQSNSFANNEIPPRDNHLQFQKWAKEYGPIYSLKLGTKTMIVLSSDQAVKDLLDKKSNIYSSKPDLYVSAELISGGYRMLFMKYDQTWRMFRKMCHSLLNVQTAKTYVPYQVLENKQMLNDMLDSPDDFVNHLRRLTVLLVFGRRVPSKDDADMHQLFEGVEKFAVVTQQASSQLLDLFPVLRNLPDFVVPIRRYAKDLHKAEKALYMKHYLRVKEGIQNGTAKDCFCVEMAKVQKDEGFSDEQAAYISGTLLEAGSDTTTSTLIGFIQAMACFPRVQEKAQAEIERVVGGDRLPTMDDEPHLSYIRAMIKESLRWMPTTITGAVPHATTKDDEYMGYHIPQGAGIMMNVWAIHMDPERHPNPREFRPERYEGDEQTAAESAANPDASQRDHFTFGAGRRICQGMHVAERSLFLGMSRMLWGFHIAPKVRDGKVVPIDPDQLTQGFVCGPETFECEITPRSEKRAKMIREDWMTAKKYVDPVSQQLRLDVTLDKMSFK